MTQDQIRKLWFAVGAVLLYYAANTWLVTQGGEEVFGLKLVTRRRAPAALVGIGICTCLLIICSVAARLFARRSAIANSESSSWADRIPVAIFDRIDAASVEGRVYQGLMFFFLSIFPLIALAHFWDIVADAPIRIDEGTDGLGAKARIGKYLWNWSEYHGIGNYAQICSNVDESRGCQNYSTIWPGLSAWLLMALTAAALVAAISHWLEIARRHKG
jgi:succinate dehydrogenase hydrophobic anchor subunit